jgi:hypothetical protein
MDLGQLYQELLSTARKMGVEVRAEAFDPGLSDAARPRGGLCAIRGKQLILVDARGSLPDRIATVAGALSQMDLESVFLPPCARRTKKARNVEDGVPSATDSAPQGGAPPPLSGLRPPSGCPRGAPYEEGAPPPSTP